MVRAILPGPRVNPGPTKAAAPHCAGTGVSILALRAVMTINRIIVISGFCIIPLGAAFAGDYAAASVSLAAALAQAVGFKGPPTLRPAVGDASR